MLLDEIRDISSSKKDLRNFGYVIGSAALIVGVLLWYNEKPNFWYWGVSGISIAFVGLISPKILKPLQIMWMTFAVIMGFVMTRVILSILYYLTITPIGLIMRLSGKDILDEKIDKEASTYWQKKKVSTRGNRAYEQQF